MLNNILNNKIKILAVCAAVSLFFVRFCPAAVLDSWQAEGAYKPEPILLVNDFTSGNASQWDVLCEQLAAYFSKYASYGSYLEVMEQSSDYSGTAQEKINQKVNELLSSSRYGAFADKLNLVGYDLGGLAVRSYLSDYPGAAGAPVNKAILIAVPNRGAVDSGLLVEAAAVSPKIGWLNIPAVNVLNSGALDEITRAVARQQKETEINHIDSLSVGGEAALNFLGAFNEVEPPAQVKYYGIISTIPSYINWMLFHDYNGGDGVISRNSQMGKGQIKYAQVYNLNAAHWDVLDAITREPINPVLILLDSEKPQIRIVSDASSGVVNVKAGALRIKGEVYKEYLPADSELGVKIEAYEGGKYFEIDFKTFPLSPTDLWIAGDPDSPVAEFDQEIVFPRSGAYRVTCEVKNPAEVVSEAVTVDVDVTM